MNEKWQKTFAELNMYSPSLECTCKVLPPNVKKYIKERCGAAELSKIVNAIHGKHWIVLTGPSPTGKTTIRDILWSLGYPFVIDEFDMARIIHTSGTIPLDSLKPIDDILAELGID